MSAVPDPSHHPDHTITPSRHSGESRNPMDAGWLLAHYNRIADAPDAVARLRRFVLDLAVRGKLVEQDPTDEPAESLLARIAKEKARLKATSALRRLVKPVDLDSTSLPFPLAAGWKWAQISQLGIISPRNTEEDKAPVSFVPMTMIRSEYGVRHSHEVREWGSIKKGYTHFAEGDVGLAKITPCFENGKSTVFRNLEGSIGAGTTELHIVRPLLTSPEYIALFLKSWHFIGTGIGKMTGTAGQKRVPKDYFAHSPFPLPPLAEQHRIVAKVDELMALCDRLEATRARRAATRDRLATASLRRLTAPDTDTDATTFRDHARFALDRLPALTTRPNQIKTLRQTILDLAVRGKLAEQSREDGTASKLLNEINAQRDTLIRAGKIRKAKALPKIDDKDHPFDAPAYWIWCRLGNLVLDSDSGWSPRTESHAREGDAWGVLKVSAVSWDQFDPSANKQVLPGTEPRLQAQVHKGDFLLSRANTAELVARAVLVSCEPARLMMSDKIVRLYLDHHCDHRFIWLVNNYARYARAYYAKCATGVSPSMKNVSRATILQLPVPLPPLAEQHRIVAKVDELMALCDQLEASLAKAETTRSRLLEATLREALQPAAHEPESA